MEQRAGGAAPGQPLGNLVLDVLSAGTLDALRSNLKRTYLHKSQILARRGRPLKRVVFPTSAVIIMSQRAGHERVPVLSIGSEGLVGHWLGLSAEPAEADITCEVPGHAFEVPSRTFVAALVDRPELAGIVTRLAQSAAAQLMRNIVCVSRHPLAQRCARQILEVALRRGDEFPLTHDTLAEWLSVTRPSVTREMSALAGAGAISYRRGIIRVHDRTLLERASCDCYRTFLARRHWFAGNADHVGSPSTVR